MKVLFDICRMFAGVRTSTVKGYSVENLHVLERQLLQFAFFNFFLVSLIGLLLRSFPFLSSFPLEYKNILHGHSHFAFGGWVMPVLVALFLRTFPEIATRVPFKHWRNSVLLLLVSAYGMLLSFPVQGYKAVSITFSTLSIAAGYYMTVLIWRALKTIKLKTSHLFIKWGLIYFAISAIGPFATGPLIAMGKQGSPLYFDAIYFYLHFQYNGFFSFWVLALLYKMLEQKSNPVHGQRVFVLFNLACMPTYALSVLWNHPPVLLNVIGGVGALLQLVGVFYLLKDISRVSWKKSWVSVLFLFSVIAFTVKAVLQVLSALPSVALLAYHQRNFVIAYLHLVLLGFISVFVFAQVAAMLKRNKGFLLGFVCFLFAFICTELLLLGNAFSLTISHYTQWLFAFSVFFPVGIFWMMRALSRCLTSTVEMP